MIIDHHFHHLRQIHAQIKQMKGTPMNDVLSAELLGKIFQFHKDSCPQDQLYQDLAIICSICRRWRNVATSDSSLWYRLHITGSLTCPAPSLLELYIERSSSRLLHISFGRIHSSPDAGPDAELARKEYLQSVLAILLPHVHRWQVFTYTQADQVPAFALQMISTIPFRKATALEQASLSTPGVGERDDEKILLLVGPAPALQKLHWSFGMGFPSRSSLTSFPWHKLRHFDFLTYCLTPEELSKFLSQCISVITLRVTILDPIAKPFSIPLLHSSKLRALHLAARTMAIGSLLSSFNCPGIEVLSLSLSKPRRGEDLWGPYKETLTHMSLLPKFLKFSIVMDRKWRGQVSELLSIPQIVNIPIVQLALFGGRGWIPENFSQIEHEVACAVPQKTVNCEVVHLSRMHAGWADSQVLQSLRSDSEFGEFDLSIT